MSSNISTKRNLGMSRLAKAVGVVTVLLCSQLATAGLGEVRAPVGRFLLSEDGLYGGCLVLLTGADFTDPSKSEVQNNCAPDQYGQMWVTFACDGTRSDVISKSTAQTFLAAAQLAYVTGENLVVVADDNPSLAIDGFCLARRVDNIKP